MAVDTAPKRRSIMEMGSEGTMPGIPAPDGTISQQDRQHLLWLYSGIAAGGPPAGGTLKSLSLTGVGT